LAITGFCAESAVAIPFSPAFGTACRKSGPKQPIHSVDEPSIFGKWQFAGDIPYQTDGSGRFSVS
jgi:hypothetical protein